MFFITFALSRAKRGCNVSKLLCLPVKSVGGEILHKLPNPNLFSPFPSISNRFTMKSRTKQNCQFNGVTESNSTGIVLKAYKSAGKIDAKCVIVCAYECAIYAHLKPSSKDSNTEIHLFSLFHIIAALRSSEDAHK